MDNLKSKAKLSTKQIVAICFVFAVSAALFITASYFMLYEPDPGNKTIPFIDTGTGTYVPSPTESGKTTEPLPTYEPTEKKSYNFLVIGHDRVAVLADVIMLINYNVTDGEVAIMQIPRDTYIRGSSYGQANVAFSSFFVNAQMAGSKNPTLDAVTEFTKLIEKTLCVNISYSAVMNLDGFTNIVDILGGVEMDVPFDLDYEDEFQNLYIHVKAGRQVLKGANAEGVVRFRNSFVQADIGRGNMQKMFMAAFLKKLITGIDISNVTQIANQVMKNVTTDLKVDDIVYFGKNALNLNLAKVTIMTIPSSGTSTGGIVINRKAALDRINKYFNLYSSDITDSLFDRSRVMCPTDEYSMGKYYDNSPEIAAVYTAQGIIDNPIDIPRM